MLRLRFFSFKTRRGKELPSSSAVDSPSVITKLATTPHAINYDMSQVIDDATSAMDDANDDASTLLDDNVPLGEFLDEQLARVRENEITEMILMKVMMKILPLDMNCLLCLRVMLWMKKLLETSLLAMIDMILRNC